MRAILQRSVLSTGKLKVTVFPPRVKTKQIWPLPCGLLTLLTTRVKDANLGVSTKPQGKHCNL